MIYVLFTLLSLFSFITHSMNRRKEITRKSITMVLNMQEGQGEFKYGSSYYLINDNDIFYEKRENPTTGLTEKRYFTPEQVAHVAYDNPNIIADIVLKQ